MAAINFRLELLASIVLTTIMVDHYPLSEFLHAAKLNCFYHVLLVAALCYVALASPPRHQHLRCFHLHLLIMPAELTIIEPNLQLRYQ